MSTDLILLCVWSSLIEWSFGGFTFTFMIFKNCSCSYDDTGFAELEINGVNINTTIIKGKSDFLKLTLPEFKLLRFRWKNIKTVTDTCCWSIVNPVLTKDDDRNTSPGLNVDVCYRDLAYEHYNKIWTCSMPGKNSTVQFQSSWYIYSSGILSAYRKNFQIICQNKTSKPLLISNLPCSNSQVSVSTSSPYSSSSISPTIRAMTQLSRTSSSSSIINSTQLMASGEITIYTALTSSDITPTRTFTRVNSMLETLIASTLSGTSHHSNVTDNTPSNLLTTQECIDGTVPMRSVLISNTTPGSMQRLALATLTSNVFSTVLLNTSIIPPPVTNVLTSAILSSSSLFPFRVSPSSMSPVIPTNPPSKKMCNEEGIWEKTPAESNATGVCFRGTVNATRRCGVDGIWDSPYCLVSAEVDAILKGIPKEGVKMLSKIISKPSSNVSLEQAVSILDILLKRNASVTEEFTNDTLNSSKSIISQAQSRLDLNRESRRSIGAQLLQTLDSFALNMVEPSAKNIAFGNSITLRVSKITGPVTTNITGIALGTNFITLPPDILGKEITQPVRIASFFYQNLSNLLLPKENGTAIISPVISSTINCLSCPTDQLNNSVIIQLQLHQDLSVSSVFNISCVFFEFENTSSSEDDSLPTGDWITKGCSTILEDNIVTCSCNHLTHFAILLSPGVDKISQQDIEILSTIGLVLVPVSLLCMVLIILTYSMMRSLWSLRNYIHIMLCMSLFMVQLVFIIGVDKTEQQRVCSAIAVLLQYLFLVTFMWMLMEGVVLYVLLVKVIVQNKKLYIIGFTVVSYITPALYMAISIPIGLSVGEDDVSTYNNYLYYQRKQLTACWLNYETGFIWTFIAPVIIILLVNIGFFIMAVVIMARHSKKKKKRDGSSVTVKHWLKTSVSLTLVMGITWLAGVMVFRKESATLAYIVTVFIAGQGILLFIILVPLSKQVRDSYYNLWKQRKFQSDLLSKLVTTPFFLYGNSSTKSKTDLSRSFSASIARNHNNGIETEQSALEDTDTPKKKRMESTSFEQHVNHYEMLEDCTVGQVSPLNCFKYSASREPLEEKFILKKTDENQCDAYEIPQVNMTLGHRVYKEQ